MALLLGGIVMWSGAINEIPDGWQLCDGTNETPDLRNRMIIGAGDEFSVNDTGGFADAALVSHNHSCTTNTTGNHSHTLPRNPTSTGVSTSLAMVYNNGLSSRGLSNAGSHSHTVAVPNSGTSATNANLPPYYALAFIQQVE